MTAVAILSSQCKVALLGSSRETEHTHTHAHARTHAQSQRDLVWRMCYVFMEAEGSPGELVVKFLSRLKTGKPEELAVKCGSPVRRKWDVPAQQWDIKAGHSSPPIWFYSGPEGNLLYWIQKQPHRYTQKQCLISCLLTQWPVQLTYNINRPRSPTHCCSYFPPFIFFLWLTLSKWILFLCLLSAPPHQLHKDRSLRELCTTIPQVPGGAHKNSLRDD